MASVKYDEGKIIEKAGELADRFSEVLKNHGTDETHLAAAFSPYRQTLKDLWHSGYSKQKIADIIAEICGIKFSESQVRTLFKNLGIISRKKTHKSSGQHTVKDNNQDLSHKSSSKSQDVPKDVINGTDQGASAIHHAQGVAKLDM